MKKHLFWPLLLLSALLLTLPCSAEDQINLLEQVPTEYEGLTEVLPQALRDLLPDELFSKDARVLGEGVQGISSFSYLLRTLLSLIGLRLGDAAALLLTLCGIVLLSAVVSALKGSIKSEGVGAALSLCTTLGIATTLIAQSYRTLTAVTRYFETLNRFTAALIPLMGALYTLGGNTGAAAASASGLSLYMTLTEELIGKSILPFCGVCMALALVNACASGLHLDALLGAIKKNYATVLAFLMMLLLAMLSSQTLLAAQSDTLIARGAKFAASNLFPVVGGSVSELLRTVSAGVGYLRGAVGICGVLLLLLLLLPTLAELMLLRLVWQLAASLAEMLGCTAEKRLLGELASLMGYLVSAVCICSSILFLSLTLLIRCASAIG